jgi:hypothetical protein
MTGPGRAGFGEGGHGAAAGGSFAVAARGQAAVAAMVEPETHQLAAEACTGVEQLVHHLMLVERRVLRGERSAGRRREWASTSAACWCRGAHRSSASHAAGGDPARTRGRGRRAGLVGVAEWPPRNVVECRPRAGVDAAIGEVCALSHEVTKFSAPTPRPRTRVPTAITEYGARERGVSGDEVGDHHRWRAGQRPRRLSAGYSCAAGCGTRLPAGHHRR